MQEIFSAIQTAAKQIASAIAKEDASYSDNQNSSGEDQLKLDLQSDAIIEKQLQATTCVKTISSEEKEGFTHINDEGIYTVCYDPLDGSSLVDVNLSVGSIFGIYEGDAKGKNIKAACYVVYGPRVELVFAEAGFAPKLYRLHEGDFVFIKELCLRKSGTINATGGTQKHWPIHHRQMIEQMFEEGYTLRYSGGMVPDLHQLLLKGGGLFSYPGTADKPEGKLRMLFEVFPFAFIFRQAGGDATEGTGCVLDLLPAHPHDTTPCFFGSMSEIERVRRCYG
ncbi:MAG: class 1 fructose-bisphosphatase [Campylobacterota bacterium]